MHVYQPHLLCLLTLYTYGNITALARRQPKYIVLKVTNVFYR
jgi:hypothetical protein